MRSLLRFAALAAGLASVAPFPARAETFEVRFEAPFESFAGPLLGAVPPATLIGSLRVDVGAAPPVVIPAGTDAGGGAVFETALYGYPAEAISVLETSFGTKTWTEGNLEPRIPRVGFVADVWFDRSLADGVHPRIWLYLSDLDGAVEVGGAACGATLCSLLDRAALSFDGVAPGSPLAVSVRAVDPDVEPENLVLDGSFERPHVDAVFGAESPAEVGGWNVGDGDVAWVPASAWEAAEGSQSLELQGNAAGSIYQDLPTTPSSEYLVSFAYAGDPGAAEDKSFAVLWDGEEVARPIFDQAGQTPAGMGYASEALLLRANDDSTRLEFKSHTGDLEGDDASCPSGPCYGPVLDDVRVSLLPVPVECAKGEVSILANGAALCVAGKGLVPKKSGLRAPRNGRIGLTGKAKTLQALAGREDLAKLGRSERAALRKLTKALSGAVEELAAEGLARDGRGPSSVPLPKGFEDWTVEQNSLATEAPAAGFAGIGGSANGLISKTKGDTTARIGSRFAQHLQLEECHDGATTRRAEFTSGYGQSLEVEKPSFKARASWGTDATASIETHLDPATGKIATYDAIVRWSVEVQPTAAEQGIVRSLPTQTYRGHMKVLGLPLHKNWTVEELSKAITFLGFWGPRGRLRDGDDGVEVLNQVGAWALFQAKTELENAEKQGEPCGQCRKRISLRGAAGAACEALRDVEVWHGTLSLPGYSFSGSVGKITVSHEESWELEFDLAKHPSLRSVWVGTPVGSLSFSGTYEDTSYSGAAPPLGGGVGLQIFEETCTYAFAAHPLVVNTIYDDEGKPVISFDWGGQLATAEIAMGGPQTRLSFSGDIPARNAGPEPYFDPGFYFPRDYFEALTPPTAAFSWELSADGVCIAP